MTSHRWWTPFVRRHQYGLAYSSPYVCRGVGDGFGSAGAEYEGTREIVVDNVVPAGIPEKRKAGSPASEKIVMCVYTDTPFGEKICGAKLVGSKAICKYCVEPVMEGNSHSTWMVTLPSDEPAC
jgi:hypothetical protein